MRTSTRDCRRTAFCNTPRTVRSVLRGLGPRLLNCTNHPCSRTNLRRPAAPSRSVRSLKSSLTAAGLKRFGATCGVIGLITVILLKLVDVGFDAALPFTAGLFPLNSKVRFRTLDYDAVANINAFGFRGTQQEVRSGQIVVVGDSFTFGLGSGDEGTWPSFWSSSCGAAATGGTFTTWARRERTRCFTFRSRASHSR